MKLDDFQKGFLYTGQTLVDLRLRLFLTQAELGEILGVTSKTISLWENERGALPRTVALAMKYLDKFCPPAEKTHKAKPLVVRHWKGRSAHEKDAARETSSGITSTLAVVPGEPEGAT